MSRFKGLSWVIPSLLLGALVWPERGFVPIWDGHVYLQCVVDAAQKGLSIHSLRCGGHHAQLYMGLLALAARAVPGSMAAIVAVNFALACTALWALSSLLRRLLPAAAWWPERVLLLSCVAVHPLLPATLVQMNSDLGVFAFCFLTLALLVDHRYWGGALAGLFLCFSKETGVVIYAVLLVVHAGFRGRLVAGTTGVRTRAAVKEVAPAVLPLAAYSMFLVWWTVTQHSFAVWNQGMHEDPLNGVRLFDFDDPVLRSYAAIIFVLGFMWIPTATILTDLAVGGARMVRRLPDRPLAGVEPHLASALLVLSGLLAYALTVYRTFSNPRYFVVLAPLLLITAVVSLVRLGAGTTVRRAALATMLLLLFSVNHRSWDPVTQLAFGTFPSGDRVMYRMTSISGELRGPGRDQLCYNLQFAGFDRSLSAAFASIRPTDSTAIVFSRFNTWGLWTPLDGGTYARTAGRSGNVTPRYMDETMVAVAREQRPTELWLVEMPNDVDASARQALRAAYEETDSVRFAPRGVAVTVRHLVRRTR